MSCNKCHVSVYHVTCIWHVKFLTMRQNFTHFTLSPNKNQLETYACLLDPAMRYRERATQVRVLGLPPLYLDPPAAPLAPASLIHASES